MHKRLAAGRPARPPNDDFTNERAEAGRIHHEHELHMHGCSLLVVQVEASNFGAWFEGLGGSEGGFPFGYRALSLMERK